MLGKNSFIYKTQNNVFSINALTAFIAVDSVVFNYSKFSALCKDGCKNFNLKYSCPPYSPVFSHYCRTKEYIVINSLKINTWEQKRIYNAIRMANVIAKSIQKKAFRSIHDKFQTELSLSILENGSCRLCKKCKLQDNLPCKYPHLMRPSLEATGVDVNNLVKKAFGFELQWYKKGSFPEYQCVVGGILTNEPEVISKALADYYLKNFSVCKTEKNIYTKQLELMEELV